MDFTLLRPGKVWAALEGHPDRPALRTVERWCAGAPVPQWASDAMAARLRIRKTPRPEWAEELVADVKAIRRGVESEANGLAVLKALLEAIQRGFPQSDDGPADDPASPQKARRRGR